MRTKLIIILIVALALILRLLYFKNITFFYDQARDALTSMEIWQSDPIKILGPQTDFPGLHHGPLYWYLISPFYFLSGGNPLVVRGFFIALSLINLFFVYDLTRMLFKKKEISFLAVFLYAISFEAIQYARWLSNPAPALLTTTISFWALYKLIQGKRSALIPLLFFLGLSIQFQFFLAYQIVIFAIIWIVIKGWTLPKIDIKTLLISLAGFLLTISTFIIAEFKFHFQGIAAFVNFLKTQTLFNDSFTNMFLRYIDRLVNNFFLNIWGINLFVAGLITCLTLIVTYIFIKNNKDKNELSFLFIWTISPIIINFFAGPNATFISLGVLPAVIILTSYLLNYLKEKNKFLFPIAIAIIILGNLNLILSKNREGEVLFATQKQIILSDELKVIDWIYKEADGKPYKLNTITVPLFINSLWADLFNWYGKEKYGYMPIWWGETQVGVPGAKIKFADESPTNLHFLIIEPSSSNDDYIIAIRALENTRSEVIKKEAIGSFVVEERKITTPRIFTSQDVFFLIKNTDINELRKMGQ
jgi:4-amino-4-deoxy-L-arabinose transferase-like glycosyltransferase